MASRFPLPAPSLSRPRALASAASGGGDRWGDHHDAVEYGEASQRLAAAGRGRSLLLRMSFEEALAHFADESLDFDYIDGYAHTGQEGGKTMEQWWPKVRRGGILAGHDYHPRWLPTMNAVYAFRAEAGRKAPRARPFP